jgi:Ca-activated chloride channel homolog
VFHFENYWIFVFLIILPVLWGVHYAHHIAIDAWISQLGGLRRVRQLMPFFDIDRKKLKFRLLMLSLGLLIVAIANPRMGLKTEKVSRESVDIQLAVDISRSMLAQDIPPNRMERSRQFALKLIQELRGERIGIIGFAGEAQVLTPLTTDYAAAITQTRNLNPEQGITQGTAIEEAIEMVLRTQAREQKPKQKALLILTDAENHEEAAVAKAKTAAEKGIKVFIVSFSTPQGAPIPINKDAYAGFQLDKEGNMVQSKPNLALMEKIAQAGGGQFWQIQNTAPENIIQGFANALVGIEKNTFEQRSFDDYQTYFFLLAIPALCLLLAELFIPNKNKKIAQL